MKTALALGTFDGVHKGHMQVLSLPCGYKKIAVVFSVPPKAIISGKPTAIMTAEDKFKRILDLGIDEIYPLQFESIKNMSADEFLCFLKEEFSPDYISCGFNYHFGKKASGNTELLRSFCKENGIEFKCHPPVCEGEKPISSTEIRGFLKNGDIQSANNLLMKPFSFTAEVLSGDKRGRTIGFPTVNQKYPPELIPLKSGVYKTKISFDGEEYEGITDIGTRPTFALDYIISETYILGFSGSLYGKRVTVEPLKFLREEKKFSSVEALKKQIEEDIKTV